MREKIVIIGGGFAGLQLAKHLNNQGKYKVMVMITLTTGCRRGETMGLQWKHIDFINKTIKIEQTAQYLTGIGIFIKEPKTHSSKRTVSMPNSLVSLLKAYKSEFNARRLKLGLRWRGGKSIDEDFLFTTWEGRQAHPDSMNSWLKKFVKKNKLQPITPKCFRHMAATYLITSGTGAFPFNNSRAFFSRSSF